MPLCNEGAEYKNTMFVCGIRPTWRGDGDEIMTEVYKYVNILPVVNTVTICRWITLNKPKTEELILYGQDGKISQQ